MSLRICALIGLLAAGCARKDDIAIYRVPKEDAPATSGPSDGVSAAVRWTAPKAWQSEPASGMRVASYKAGAAEVSVVSLPGEAGGDLANVNRWRGQLGLEPWAEADLERGAARRRSGAGDLLLVDFSSPGKGRMVAARLLDGGQTWFFKMTGPSEAVLAAKPSFDAFLGSLRHADR